MLKNKKDFPLLEIKRGCLDIKMENIDPVISNLLNPKETQAQKNERICIELRKILMEDKQWKMM